MLIISKIEERLGSRNSDANLTISKGTTSKNNVSQDDLEQAHGTLKDQQVSTNKGEIQKYV